MRWIEYCIRKASRRDSNQKYRLHAIVVKGGRILYEGDNQPVSDFPFKCMNPQAEEWIGLHAEMAAIRKATPEKLRGATLYVGGVTMNGNRILTKPCRWCAEVLKDTGIKNVVWHNHSGDIGSYSIKSLA